VSTAKTNQRIGGIAKAQERTAYFQVQVRRRSAGYVRKARVQNRCEQRCKKNTVANGWQPATVFPKKPGDCCPIPQNIPQSPMKTGNTRECTYVPFLGMPITAAKRLNIGSLQCRNTGFCSR
jgi:hypothetical protein